MATTHAVTHTPIHASTDAALRGKYFDDTGSRNPTRRIGTVEDIAHGVMFALTNTFMTGLTLPIDGGEPLS